MDVSSVRIDYQFSRVSNFQLLPNLDLQEKAGGYDVCREICVFFLKIHYNYSAFKCCILQGDTLSRKKKSTPNEF